MLLFQIVKPWPQTLSAQTPTPTPTQSNPVPKLGWAGTKIMEATTSPTEHLPHCTDNFQAWRKVPLKLKEKNQVDSERKDME